MVKSLIKRVKQVGESEAFLIAFYPYGMAGPCDTLLTPPVPAIWLA